MSPTPDTPRDDAQDKTTAPIEAQESIPMAETESPPQAAPATPSMRPPAPIPTAVQVIDKILDAVGCLLVAYLCDRGKIGGELAAGLIVFVVTGNTGIRTLGARAGGAGLGAAGLLLMAGLGALGLLAPHAPAVADAASTLGQRGHARGGVLALLAVVGLIVLGLSGCPHVTREPALAPPPHGCDAGATLCHEGAPWRCGPEGHWSQADRRCDRLGEDASVVCCPTPSALRPGVLLHACVPTEACAAEVSR